MAKAKAIYSCTECGGSSPKWQGQCPHCNAWNTLVESVAVPSAVRFQTVAGTRSAVTPLSAVDARESQRIATGLEELDRVLGGGLVPGGVVLLGGDPGIGKSTLLLQACAALGAAHRTLYVTGEESVEQVALRAKRDLLGGFLARDVQRPMRGAQSRTRLQQQRRLADARIAAQQDHAARHEAAAEHAIEFLQSRRNARRRARRNRRERRHR